MADDEKYVPTTDEVRNNMAFGVVMASASPESAADIDFPWPGYREVAKEQFDLWLNSYKKQLRKTIADDIRRRPAGNELLTFSERLEIVAKRVERGS